jgi:carbon-monoxide dehydrogenase medium subunit
MYSASFDYHRPKTVAEAVSLLQSNREAKILAGGHSLLPAMKLRMASPGALVDIGHIPGLAGIQAGSGELTIGALTTYAAVAASDLVKGSCRVLADAVKLIGDPQVRNRGTVGGSLAHADPGADLPTVMLMLDAKMVATGAKATRDIPADQFFLDMFTTALKADEILTALKVPTYGAKAGAAYLKHRHPASGYAVVGVAAFVQMHDGKCSRVSLTIGGATGSPVRAKEAEALLIGKATDAAAITAAAARVGAAVRDGLSDPYASAEYRAHLAQVLARRALTAAVEKARS